MEIKKILPKNLPAILCYLLIILFCSFNVYASVKKIPIAIINAPVTNMYSAANGNADVVSQAIYNTQVKLLQTKHGFALIQTPDEYQGWVDRKVLSSRAIYPEAHIAKVINLFANVYQEPNTMSHQPLVTVPFTTQFPIVNNNDNGWIKVLLANGRVGFIQQGEVAIDPKPLTMQKMLKLSHNFVGLPYLWGGKSTYGFDCSSFVQMLYAQMGIALPRDTGVQAYSPDFINVSKQNLRPGDILYFGWNDKISHTGIYLGNNKFINATAYQNPIVQISDLRNKHWQDIFIAARHLDSAATPKFEGTIKPIPESVKQQMRKYTWHPGCPVPLENLAYLQLSYWGFDNRPHLGVLIVNKAVAQEVLDIFKDLYNQKFPIEKMRPMYVYHGNDDAAMLDDNSSSFNCRAMTDFPNQYSIHSYGEAIDVNTLINPYVNDGKVSPQAGAKYLDRSAYHKGKIISGSKVCEDFAKHGWVWGGSWPGKIHDYQHFEKPLASR